MHADLEAVRDLLQRTETRWAVLEVKGDRARVVAALELEALYRALDGQFHESWSLGWAVDATTPLLVRCRLELLGGVREGLASAPALTDAQALAAAEAARAWGMLGGSPEAQWVEYDPEEGPNTEELAPAAAPVAARTPVAPLEPVMDPQLLKARKHIDDLLETLKVAGLGGRAARILSTRGYGNTLEESREIYRELKAIQSGA